MIFDCILIDVTTPRPYEFNTLATQAIGGTEASCIRIMEGLGQIGIRTAIFQHNLDVPLEGNNCWYLPASYLDKLEKHPEVVIALRGVQYLDRFPRSKKISFHQDVPTDVLLKLRDRFLEFDVTVVGASKWHKRAIQEKICFTQEIRNPRVRYIYNPVPDRLFVDKKVHIKYNPNKVVWPMSPHKGLDGAIDLMGRYIEISANKDMRLHIFNPGYFFKDRELPTWVINHGPVPCAELWQHVSESLCVFYPTSFQETFGCIMAEANAVHTPVLTHEIAALRETVSGHGQFVSQNPKHIIKTLDRWQKGDRPVVQGQEKFKQSNVVFQWTKLFKDLLL